VPIFAAGRKHVGCPSRRKSFCAESDAFPSGVGCHSGIACRLFAASPRNCRNSPAVVLVLLDDLYCWRVPGPTKRGLFMNIEAIPPDQLTAAHLEAWDQIQRNLPQQDSPFFRSEFAQAVAAVRRNCETAVLSKGGQFVGFWPFYRAHGNVAYPIADTLTDFQGVITCPDVEWIPEQLLRGCHLSAFYFDRLIARQHPFAPYHWQCAGSAYMDMSGGVEVYLQRRSNPRSNLVQKAMQKWRKIEREIAPLRFERHTSDEAVFRKLIEWKTDQYRRTGTRNVFAKGWTAALLERVLQQQHAHFSGMQSVLYAGDEVAAIHLGMASRGVLHYWFTAYNPAYSRYSPGLLLLLAVARAAQSLGIHRIDLGKGEEAFKTRFMTDATEVAEGAVDLRPLVRPIRRFWLRAQDRVLQSRLRSPARFVVRKTRAMLGYEGE